MQLDRIYNSLGMSRCNAWCNALPFLPSKASSVPAAEAPAEVAEGSGSLEEPTQVAQELPVQESQHESHSPPVTPPPKVIAHPDLSLPNGSQPKHCLYKSERCGSFCRDCKLSSPDPTWFRDQPCIPNNFKAEVGENEEVRSPVEGEAESIQLQVQEAERLQSQLRMLQALKEEEAHLEELLLQKSNSESCGAGEVGLNHGLKDPRPPICTDNMDTVPWHPLEEDHSHKDMQEVEEQRMNKQEDQSTKAHAVVAHAESEEVEGKSATLPSESSLDRAEPNPREQAPQAVIPSDAAGGDRTGRIRRLAHLCSQFQESANAASSAASDQEAVHMIRSLKRSLDAMLDEASLGKGPESDARAAKLQKEEKEEARPAAVERAKYVSPQAQVKLTGRVPEGDEEDEDAEGEVEGDEAEEDEGNSKKKKRGRGKAKRGQGKAKRGRGKAKRGRGKAKVAKSATKARPKAAKRKRSEAKPKEVAGSKARKPAAKGKAKAKAKANKGKSEGSSSLCPYCTDKKKLRSFRCCAYARAKAAATKDGCGVEEATARGKKASCHQLNTQGSGHLYAWRIKSIHI